MSQNKNKRNGKYFAIRAAVNKMRQGVFMPPTLGSRVVTVGTPNMAFPATSQQYFDYIGPTYSEKDLSEDVLNELRKQVAYAKSLGFSSWYDYDELEIDGVAAPSMQYSLYGRTKPDKFQLFRRWISSDPVNVIETTLGHYDFYQDENGDYHVTDVYDFNPSKGGIDVYLAPILGDVKDRKKNIHWDINIGNLNGHNTNLNKR